MKKLETKDLYQIHGGNSNCRVTLGPFIEISPPLPRIMGSALAEKWNQIGKELNCGAYNYEPLFNDSGDVIGVLNMAIMVYQ